MTTMFFAPGTTRGLSLLLLLTSSRSFQTQIFSRTSRLSFTRARAVEEWKGDFDGYGEEGGGDELTFSSIFGSRPERLDRSGVQVRQFSLGDDLVLSNYVGAMGFDEVTDWEYFQQDEDGRDRRRVEPNPLDPAQPTRTRKSSGSVVRVFRGEFEGLLGATIRSKGMDRRVLVKEFAGEMALKLAEAEWNALGKLQSSIPDEDEDWIQPASARSVAAKKDNRNVCKLVAELAKRPYLGILGEVNLAELEGNMDPNEFYRALGVPPPKQGAIWIVYEYAGLQSLQQYCQPAEIRRSRIPPKKVLFGIQAPPAVPKWADRANYIKAIMKQTLEALATVHEAGVSHKSIGRSSVILSSKEMDKMVASDVYTTAPYQLRVKLADFGFSGDMINYDSEFIQRARSFGIRIKTEEDAQEYAVAEDLHALAFVYVGLMLTSLAEVPSVDFRMPPTDEDSIQRQLVNIFKKDMMDFREYISAEDIWSKVVDWLDQNEGWTMLESLWLARERVARNQGQTARDVLSNSKFFA